MTQPPRLFDPVPVASRTLSAAYAGADYRVAPGRVARFVPYHGRATCDECGARQHETRGRAPEGGGLRAPARYRRLLDGLALLLCHEHTELWRDRDGADLATALRKPTTTPKGAR